VINEKPLDFGDAIVSLSPDAEWVVEDNDLDNIIWLNNEYKPNKKEIKKELQRLIQEKESALAKKENAKLSALQKLSDLGLTEEEAKAIIGL
jgi:hypothetical protein